jgi:hypothetical protein
MFGWIWLDLPGFGWIGGRLAPDASPRVGWLKDHRAHKKGNFSVIRCYPV